MTDWVIGDEIAEEINTTYDLNKQEGDTPSAYFGAGAEPIDAKNGVGFMDVGKLGEGYTFTAKCNDCGTTFSYKRMGYCPNCSSRDYRILDSSEFFGHESLNKDGTGVAKAVRGLDPTKTKRKWLRFVYVSKSDCDICKPFDGKVYHIDDEDRPCIPRLEEWDGAHPVTHPNCKCKWVRTFDPEDFGGESFIGESSHPQNHAFLSEYPKGSPEEFDECQSCGFPASDHKAFNGETRDDIDKEDMDLARKVYGDAFDKADDIAQGYMVIKALLQRLHGESRIKAGESEPSAYPIQKMLDNIVNKSLNKSEQKEVKEMEMDGGFNLTTIMQFVADKLAAKLGKKLGVESYTGENKYKELGDMFDKLTNKMDDVFQSAGFDKNDDLVGMIGFEKNVSEEYDIGECPICEGTGTDPNSSETCEFCDGSGRFDRDNKTQGVEGGRGSGKVGHAPWMLGGEAMDDCKNCMIQTERDDNGKCILCGG